MRLANGGKCQACGEELHDGDPEGFFHFHRNAEVVVLFHGDCLMPYLKERYVLPVGLPMPCACSLEEGEQVDQPVFVGGI
jgi:hypothetical protein